MTETEWLLLINFATLVFNSITLVNLIRTERTMRKIAEEWAKYGR